MRDSGYSLVPELEVHLIVAVSLKLSGTQGWKVRPSTVTEMKYGSAACAGDAVRNVAVTASAASTAVFDTIAPEAGTLRRGGAALTPRGST
jgi:hypothetical protein